MTRYLTRRILGAIPLILGVATVVFILLNIAPGDPSSRFISPNVSPQVLEQIRQSMGLGEPIHVRYLKWMAGIFRGDLGYSLAKNQPVVTLLGEILPNTLLLSGLALLLGFSAGIFLGVLQAVRQHSRLDRALGTVSLFLYSVPTFWLALMMILVFGLHARSVWGWPVYFPISGMQGVDAAFFTPWEQLIDRARHLTLPVTTLALILAAAVSRYVRASMLEVINQDYVRTARAKGLSEARVILKHSLRNAMIPVATLFGLYLPFLFSGTVFVEWVFAWPGMGKLVVEAIGQRDYPVVMAGSVVFAGMVVLGNVVADVLYAVIDPRIRYRRGGGR